MEILSFLKNSKIKKILSILSPKPSIGGLGINDSALKFVLAEDSKISKAAVDLPPGILEGGKVKDLNAFKSALSNLHSKIIPNTKKKIYIVLNVPDINVYTQVFNLPPAAENNIEEAVRLNLQMISPSDFSSVYSDWQRVDKAKADSRQIEVLGAFIQKQIINDLATALKETNFVVVAIEFYSLAISRVVSAMNETSNFCLLMRLDASGISFSIIRKGNLYFQRFISWPIQEEKQITFNILKDLIVREVQKVLNFSSKQWPDKIEKILFVSSSLEDKIAQIITENFPLAVQKLSLSSELKDPFGLWSFSSEELKSLDSNLLGAFSSSLRGLIGRSRDIIISLASTGTEEEFRQNQIIYFVKMWRNIIMTSFGFVAVVFIVMDIFMASMISSLNSRLTNLVNLPETGEINDLQTKAVEFNSKIAVAFQAKQESLKWSQFLEEIKNIAGNDIIINRIFVQSPTGVILFNGEAANESLILSFKENLVKNDYFKEVDLPLSSVNSLGGGLLDFSVNFKIDDSLISPQ